MQWRRLLLTGLLLGVVAASLLLVCVVSERYKQPPISSHESLSSVEYEWKMFRWLLHEAVMEQREEEKEKRLVEAVKWVRKAAERGDAEAQYVLGRCYSLAVGISEDREEAIKWYRKAAIQGHEEARKQLFIETPHYPHHEFII